MFGLTSEGQVFAGLGAMVVALLRIVDTFESHGWGAALDEMVAGLTLGSWLGLAYDSVVQADRLRHAWTVQDWKPPREPAAAAHTVCLHVARLSLWALPATANVAWHRGLRFGVDYYAFIFAGLALIVFAFEYGVLPTLDDAPWPPPPPPPPGPRVIPQGKRRH